MKVLKQLETVVMKWTPVGQRNSCQLLVCADFRPVFLSSQEIASTPSYNSTNRSVKSVAGGQTAEL